METHHKNLALKALLTVLITGCVGGNTNVAIGSEREFAEQLGERMCSIMNEDPNKGKASTPFEETRYADPTGKLAMMINPMDMSGVFGGALQQDGLREYIDMNGVVNCDDYLSPLGSLTGRLAWELHIHMPHKSRVSDYTYHRLTGVLLTDDDDSVRVDYAFKVNAANSGYDLSSVAVSMGAVQIGDREQVKFE